MRPSLPPMTRSGSTRCANRESCSSPPSMVKRKTPAATNAAATYTANAEDASSEEANDCRWAPTDALPKAGADAAASCTVLSLSCREVEPGVVSTVDSSEVGADVGCGSSTFDIACEAVSLLRPDSIAIVALVTPVAGAIADPAVCGAIKVSQECNVWMNRAQMVTTTTDVRAAWPSGTLRFCCIDASTNRNVQKVNATNNSMT
mmetsp:Transcript_42911/g.78406  ORF Transcript_42911/g.78406 Transcript_42911/m.78406 type:complete len:204 (-) Transcript_42911:73-684(-)